MFRSGFEDANENISGEASPRKPRVAALYPTVQISDSERHQRDYYRSHMQLVVAQCRPAVLDRFFDLSKKFETGSLLSMGDLLARFVTR